VGVKFFLEGLPLLAPIRPIKSLIDVSGCVRYRLNIGLNYTHSKSTSNFSRVFFDIMGRSSSLLGVVKDSVALEVSPSRATGGLEALLDSSLVDSVSVLVVDDLDL